MTPDASSEWEPVRQQLEAGAAAVAVDTMDAGFSMIEECHRYLYENRINVGIGCTVNPDGTCHLTVEQAPDLPEWSEGK